MFARRLARVAERVERVLDRKKAAGKTFDNIAEDLGVTNAYAAQLLLGQARLTREKATLLQSSLHISDTDIQDMVDDIPARTYDSEMRKDPTVHRLHEAVTLYSHALKELINEKAGDGIMSAIDFYLNVDKVKGAHGEDRIVITMNGKFLPHIEQRLEDMTWPPNPQK